MKEAGPTHSKTTERGVLLGSHPGPLDVLLQHQSRLAACERGTIQECSGGPSGAAVRTPQLL